MAKTLHHRLIRWMINTLFYSIAMLIGVSIVVVRLRHPLLHAARKHAV